MNILFISAEVAPFAKVGGLADVAGSLPKEIHKLDHDIRVILPLYGSIDTAKYELTHTEGSETSFIAGEKEIRVSLMHSKLPDSNVTVYFIVNEEYFGSFKDVYPRHKNPLFEHERFVLFGLSSLKLMEKIDFKSDIIHCNDWHTANIPVQLKTNPDKFSFYKDTKTLLSIHNLAYQGKCSSEIINFANLDPKKVLKSNSIGDKQEINWLKGGIIYSDMINTVSKKYAEEIQTPEYGEGLDTLLIENKEKLYGILNGIDYKNWNPATDKHIPENYSADNLSGKKVCKNELQKEFHLEENDNIPVIGLVSRLVDQKGLDLIEEISNDLMNLDMQFIVLGAGEEKYEALFEDLTKKSKNIKAKIGFDAALAQRIYAGSDFFLMPSKFEPCGLGQLISLKYGTVPIVRKTGGLSDTIIDFTSNNQEGNGFVFENYDSKKLLATIKEAIKTYRQKDIWEKLVNTAINNDFSWNKSANEYIELYIRLLKG